MSINELKQNMLSKPIPNYSKGEETFNWISHFIGIFLGLVSLIYFISLNIINNYPTLTMVALFIYSFSLMILYSVSTTYHLLNPNSPWKRLFRLIDHNTIYILIAGTYAPICAVIFPNRLGIIMMSIQFVCLIIGSILNFINLNNKAIKVITVILYVIMGWLVVFCYPAITMMPFNVMMYILFGGIAYTIGVIFYAAGKKKKWMHSVFHLFVIVGSIIQLIGIIVML